MRAARISERKALGHDWVDLATTKQLEQRAEVLTEPLRVAGTSTHRKRLVALAQLLDPVGGHPPAGREQAPADTPMGYICSR